MRAAARILAPCVPYVAVGIGLHLARSAWAAILGYHAGMCLLLLAGGGWSEARKAAAGWSAMVGVATVLISALPGPLLWLLWPVVEAGPLDQGLRLVGLEGPSFRAFVAYYVLVNPLLEEVYWRGWLASASPWPALEDALFAGYHALVLVFFIGWPWIILCIACIACAAWIWRLVARRAGGLLVPVLAHVAADVSVIAVAAIISRGAGT